MRYTKKMKSCYEERIVAGVIQGICNYYDLEVLWSRVAFVILGFIAPVFAVGMYAALWLIMDEYDVVCDTSKK